MSDTKSNHLALYDNAKAALAKAANVDEVKDIRNKSVAMKIYAKQAKDRELEANAIEIRARAERRLGEMMAVQPKAKGAKEPGTKRGTTRDSEKPASLAEAGIDKNLAQRGRVAAAKSEKDFEDDVKKQREAVVSKRKPRKSREERRKEHEAAIAAGRARAADWNGDAVVWLEGTVSNAVESVLVTGAKPERVFAMLRSLIDRLEKENKPARATGTVVQTDDERRALNAALDK
jgi:hypothetical protein